MTPTDNAVVVDTPAPGVTRITLHRPEVLNALDHSMTRTLLRVLAEIAVDTTCRVVVLTGAGRGFCAGLDLRGYGDDDEVQRQGFPGRTMSRQREIAEIAVRLHELPQPVIAAVNGPAAGGGLAMVLAADVRIAATEAAFAVGFIRAGFSGCDIGLSWLLPRVIGAGHAHELMLTGRRIDAERAERIGLVTRLVPGADLQDTALAVAAEILQNPPLSVEMTKQGMWIALETPSFRASVEFENRQQVYTAMTEDRTEAVTAFLEKRPPVYSRR
ncbi:enoyl-CoA hydratase/isomerase family protein [Nakamurella sp. YIM 132087]|uniref:Enoyl-CoA hydratase/isomerase family protein n=1 Tax=Nakamurella alba TaxID=2665158 RepID=A0A7K1FPH8_9ACTN|nr:enoyl-CoA hydratase-related protein [Nakamurella alba]MTD15990.1 enoyl-CoA hydratase/isomerase family protein [Nakamurella alba]